MVHSNFPFSFPKFSPYALLFFLSFGYAFLSVGAIQSTVSAEEEVIIDPVDAAEPGTTSASPPIGSDDPAEVFEVDDLLSMDLEDLSAVSVQITPTNLDAPSTMLDSTTTDFNAATTTGDLLENATSVSLRRTSALNLDPRVRGYHSEQIAASANGMTQLKTRIDIDSLFSQIDPGIVQNITVIDGPYSSLYGPGFAFLVGETFQPPRYRNGPEMHGSTHLNWTSNRSTEYGRANLWGGAENWGMYMSYGLRAGTDYDTGDSRDFPIPASYQKWDGFFGFSRDLTESSRFEFNYLQTDITDLELPGVQYDIDYSQNNQFNFRFVGQEDPDGPEQFVLQYWLHLTRYHGDATAAAKQQTLYRNFATLPAFDIGRPVNTVAQGRSDSMGLRGLLTFGTAESTQWTVGTDWRRYSQNYYETNFDAAGDLVFDGGVFGIPESARDDIGIFTHLTLPWSEDVSFTVGGRLDWSMAHLDENDPVLTTWHGDPDDFYYDPGYDEPDEMLGMAYATLNVQLTPTLAANGGAAYAMRNPSLAELYSDEPFVPLVRFGNSYSTGNSGLDPERNMQFDLGLTCQTESVSCGVRGFYSYIQDYIYTAPAYIDPSAPDFIDGGQALGRDFTYFDWRTDVGTANENADTNQAGYTYANVDAVSLFGGDLFAEACLLDWLYVGGSMSYVQGTNHDPVQLIWGDEDFFFAPTVNNEPLQGIYPFNGKLSVRLVDPSADRWSVEFISRMVHGQDRVAFTLSELPTAGFTVFDLRGYYRLRENLKLTAGVANLLNRSYTEHGSLAIMNPAGLATFVREPGIRAGCGLEWIF